jgi:DNA topoisomerase-1
MSKNLVIVESPAKAKTIEKFLGKDYTVRSCYGHIRDLKKGNDAVDVENNFTPTYVVPTDKKPVIKELKSLAKIADTIWLASDEDREGEAISWHLFEVLDLAKKDTKRIVFNEITKSAILKAIESPRTIDKNLVDAQQARRVLDRLVGFELSPVLWKKVKPSLSAGRVQSVAVKLIVERERQITDFKPESDFKVTSQFLTQDNKAIAAILNKRFKEQKEAKSFLDKCKEASYKVEKIDIKPSFRKPSAPFTTSTLQQEASRKLGYSVSRTMILAQGLYEAGLITYMRTDSTNLSQTAIDGAKDAIISSYGPSYSNPKNFTTKKAGAQEAHEAIRPTNFKTSAAGANDSEERLYQLIWKRSIASQMSNAELEKTNVFIDISNSDHTFKASGEVIKFDGFLKVYLEGTDDEDEKEDSGLLPSVSQGENLSAKEIIAVQKYSRSAPRYTEASLVKKLEELGIGRPSTYAPTISTVQKRGYVVKESRDGKERQYAKLTLKGTDLTETLLTEITGAEKNKLFPTDIGMVVNDFLNQHFSDIMNYGFTASVEKEFDEIAQGMTSWVKMIDGFYKPFHKTVNKTLEEADRATGERELGVDPKTGKRVIARMARFGPVVQIGGGEDEEDKPKYAGLNPGQSLETITFEEALELFKLPKDLGMFEEKAVMVGIGRFGPYVRHNSKFTSIPKEIDPMALGLNEAIELIKAKREADAKKIIKEFAEEPDIRILNGRWGPYIAFKRKSHKIPKDVEPSEITLEQAKHIIANPPPKKTRAKKAKKK